MKVTLANIVALSHSIIKAKSQINPATKSFIIDEETVLLVNLQKDFSSADISSDESLIINGNFITDISPWEYVTDGEIINTIRRGFANIVMDSEDFNNRLDVLLDDLVTNNFSKTGTLNCNIHNVPGTDIKYLEVTDTKVIVYRCHIQTLGRLTLDVEAFMRKALFDQILKGNIEVEI